MVVVLILSCMPSVHPTKKKWWWAKLTTREVAVRFVSGTWC